MSDNKNTQSVDFLNSLTEEQLDNLLVMELAAEGADAEKIKRINRALRVKSGGQKDIDIQAKWQEFQSNYSATEPLYDLEDEASDNTHSQPKDRRKRRPLGAAIAAIAVIVLLSGTITAYAFGVDVFGAIATWTVETFGFAEPDAPPKPSLTMDDKPVPQQLEEFALAMSENGFPTSLLPSYLPDGYKQTELYASVDSDYSVITGVFVNGDKTIVIEIRNYNTKNRAEYEKDDGDPEIYVKNRIAHYIMTNAGRNIAVWVNGDYEMAIFGPATKDELIKMINSIYEW